MLSARGIFKLRLPLQLIGASILLISAVLSANAQKFIDRTMVVVGDNSGRPLLITYSDVLWQLALEPETPINPPSKEDVTRALELLVKQRLFALEANRLPQAPPTDAEIGAEIKDVLSQFPSADVFETRLRSVGFESVTDDNFEKMMGERVRIKKYIDFRFRSFVVVTPEDEERFFKESVLPEFRRRFPNLAEPVLGERRSQINRLLVERGVAESIEAFLDEAERNAEIVYLNID